MYSLSRVAGYDAMKAAEEFAFVVTDIEDSTSLSQQDAAGFKQVRRTQSGSPAPRGGAAWLQHNVQP